MDYTSEQPCGSGVQSNEICSSRFVQSADAAGSLRHHSAETPSRSDVAQDRLLTTTTAAQGQTETAVDVCSTAVTSPKM